MSEKHTPGPWRSDCFLVKQVGGKEIDICHTGIVGRNRPGEQAEADAALIADAPTMLRLLREVMLHLEAVERMYDHDLPEVAEIRDLLRRHGE